MRQLAGTQSKVPEGSPHSARPTQFWLHTLRIDSDSIGEFAFMSEISELFSRCVEMHKSGEHAVAAQGYAAILRADPTHADAWHLSGLLAHQSGRSSDAIDYISRAIELNSTNAEYWSNLAAIQMALGQWLPALAAADQAIEINAAMTAAHFQKGRAHAKLGQSEAALMALQRARTGGFDPALVTQEIGTVLQSIGDLAGCVNSFEESLRMNPDQPSVWLSLSRLVTASQYQFSEAQLQKMYRVSEQTQSAKDRARIAFSLAAHFDHVGEYAKAFEHWTMGNESSRQFRSVQGQGYDPAARTRRVDDLIAVFSSRFLQSLQPVRDSQRPIVVVGMPRSGTSLIEQMLSSHPEVAAGGELPFWTVAFEQQFGPPETRSKLAAVTAEWRKSTADDYDAVLSEISPQSLRVVDKMPGNYLNLGLIVSAFPNATIIHCCRDPRDSCLSCYGQLFDDLQLQLSTSDLSWLAQQYQDYARIMQHWHGVMPGRITDVYYERLVQDPEVQVRRLLKACQLSWSADCLSFHRNQRTVHTASVVQVRQPLYQSSRGRWTRYEAQLQPLSELLKNCIADYASGSVESELLH